MGLRLQNMRERCRDKGVKVCPNVNMSEIKFLEPLDEDGEREDETEIEGEDLEESEVPNKTQADNDTLQLEESKEKEKK